MFYWLWGYKMRSREPRAPLNSPAAPSNFCREPKNVLVSIHNIWKWLSKMEKILISSPGNGTNERILYFNGTLLHYCHINFVKLAPGNLLINSEISSSREVQLAIKSILYIIEFLTIQYDTFSMILFPPFNIDVCIVANTSTNPIYQVAMCNK